MISAMVLWIIFGSFCFGRAYSVAGAADLITSLVVGLNIPPMSFYLGHDDHFNCIWDVSWGRRRYAC